jgi:hypothetical protein
MLEVGLTKTGEDAAGLVATDRRVTGEAVYTLVPEAISIQELIQPAGAPLRTSFSGTIYRGRRDQGGSQLLRDVSVRVERVVMGAPLDTGAPLDPLPSYQLFGDARQLFAVHLLGGQPDFEHVVRLRIVAGVETAAQAAAIRQGAVLQLTDRANDAAHALKSGEDVRGLVTFGAQHLSVQLRVADEIYLARDAGS